MNMALVDRCPQNGGRVEYAKSAIFFLPDRSLRYEINELTITTPTTGSRGTIQIRSTILEDNTVLIRLIYGSMQTSYFGVLLFTSSSTYRTWFTFIVRHSIKIQYKYTIKNTHGNQITYQIIEYTDECHDTELGLKTIYLSQLKIKMTKHYTAISEKFNWISW